MNTLLLTLIVIYALLVLNSVEITARPAHPENDVLKTENADKPEKIRHIRRKYAKQPNYRFKYSNEPEGLATDFENYSIKLYQTFRTTMHSLQREFHKDLMKYRKFNRNIFKI